MKRTDSTQRWLSGRARFRTSTRLTEGIVERIDILAHALKESLEQPWLSTSSTGVRSMSLAACELRPAVPALGGHARQGHALSTGAMTNRLDRMEAAGLIRRLPDPSDRRGTLIEPTEAGHAAWTRAPPRRHGGRRWLRRSSVLPSASGCTTCFGS